MPICQRAAEGVGVLQVDLRGVERAVALVDDVGDALLLEHGGEDPLGHVPELVGPDAVLGPGGELDGDVLEAEDAVGRERELEAVGDLLGHLLLRAEDVGVVLGEVADAEQAVQRAAELVAVEQPGLGVADRQVPVRPLLALEELRVARAVHGLERHLRALGLREEHVLAVLAPVPRGPPELRVVELRGLDLLVAPRVPHLAAELHELVEHRGATRQPERGALGDLVEGEQPELRAEAAVVAGLGLLEALEVLRELRLGEERRPVDAREHRAARVPAPVGARDGLELEGLDALRRRRVRAPAEVRERAVRVERDGLDAAVRRPGRR